MLFQLILNIAYSSVIILLTALSFNIIYSSGKFFNITFAVIITFGAYTTFCFSKQLGLAFYYAIPFSISLSILMSICLEKFIFNVIRKNGHSFVLLITSLGIYIILQNTISLIWSDEPKSIRFSEVKTGHNVFGAYITDIQTGTIIIGLILVIVTLLFLKYSRIGLKIRAIASNDGLARIWGTDSNRVILWATIISSFLAAITGIMVAFDTYISPTMGFNLLLYGIVAMIIGGVGSTRGLICGALLLAVSQQMGA
jgi:branched-chain amino acid transport system permease protein